MVSRIPIYRAGEEAERNLLVRAVRETYEAQAAAGVAAVEAADEEVDAPIQALAPDEIRIPPMPNLIGVDPSVYRQIEAVLRSGKRHLMLYGPPGTGKTEIARYVAGVLSPRWRLITGSADWTSQDVIGGYQPVGDGKIAFIPGVLLREFDRPLVIDELNRCDIDKVIGPLFTVLSGQASTLPYRVDVTNVDSEQYVILPEPKLGAGEHEFAPTPAWRIIATINSIDKASLYQMSYALTRRFGWVYVDAPRDLDGFVVEYLRGRGLLKSEPAGGRVPLGQAWEEVNKVRVVGAAPLIDVIKSVAVIDPDLDFLVQPTREQAAAYLDGYSMYLLPMLDGILRHDAEQVAQGCAAAFGLREDDPLAADLKARLLGLAV